MQRQSPCHVPQRPGGCVRIAERIPRPALQIGLWATLQEAGHAENIPSGPSAWCCTLDADMPLLLTVEEEEQYLERSLKGSRQLLR